ncbi:DUF1501 domain-containing protein [Calycomorphotria hydatis]|uniref:Sulfatase n=1 Tax=Calycomorphotria hydatis TaxID=2528027 RepID=A0A517T9S6_9PLAN|nr:DUF1501 domain-containing protein [Calycomorphotria hydatis]QDT65130.1 hypothetical protein V22_23770 [Calycomorphotria hydatis]
MYRREFLTTASAGLSASALLSVPAIASSEKSHSSPQGKAEHVIMIWLGGGPSQVDTFDIKRLSKDGRKDPGSAYPGIDTAIPGVQVCEFLPQLANVYDRCVPVRSVHHDVIDEHAAATYRMHVGRPVSGTIVYPCIASIITFLKEPVNPLVPQYVLMGNPSPGRSPGFLGAEYGFLNISDTSGPKGLSRPARVSEMRDRTRRDLLAAFQNDYLRKYPNSPTIADKVSASQKGFRLAGPEFMSTFDVDKEPDDLRNSYKDDFGQRCLLARRLVERGSRFVEVSFNLNFINGTGWDTHNDGHNSQYKLIQSLDSALSTLIVDLEEKKLLDKTLILVAGEFGRPSSFDNGGGRGHQGKAFSVLLAGGGLQTGQAIGETDELCKKVVSDPVSVPDLFATMIAALGVDPHEEIYAGTRPVPVTDRGKPIAKLFA